MKFKSVAELYQCVPEIECQGKCEASCGVIPIYPAEEEYIRSRGLPVPRFTPDLTCTALAEGRCSIHQHRPLICRLWGNVQKMPCPHGCKPKLVSDKKAESLIKILRKLSGGKHPNIIPQGDSVLLAAPLKGDELSLPSVAIALKQALNGDSLQAFEDLLGGKTHPPRRQ